MNNDHPRHSIPWLAVLLVLAAIYAFIQISNEGRNGLIMYGVSNSSSIISPSVGAPAPEYEPRAAQSAKGEAIVPQMMQASDSVMAPAPYPSPGGSTPPATDTRELNKIYYNASLKTRDVNGLAKLVETTVRGNGGRVDQMNTSEKSGSVRFVIPQSKFDAFRDQVESFVDSRFLSVNIDSQNMLPQKQAIEKQQDYTKMNLDQLNVARKTEMSAYASKKAGVQAQIDANERETAMLDKSLQTADVASRPNIVTRQMDLYGETSSLRSQLAALEKSHLGSINSIDAQIRYANGDADALKKQDQNLMDDVATVSGTISIHWMSLWEVVHTYVPGYWIPGILLALALIAHWWHRKKTVVVL